MPHKNVVIPCVVLGVSVTAAAILFSPGASESATTPRAKPAPDFHCTGDAGDAVIYRTPTTYYVRRGESIIDSTYNQPRMIAMRGPDKFSIEMNAKNVLAPIYNYEMIDKENNNAPYREMIAQANEYCRTGQTPASPVR